MPAFADGPDGPSALELADGGAVQRWSLRAGSSRGAWDFTDASALDRVDWRAAVSGEAASASLALDWQRRLPVGSLSAHAFGRLARTDLADGSRGIDSFEQRLRDCAHGAGIRWTAGGQTIAVAFRGSGRATQSGFAGAGTSLATVRDDDAAESALQLSAATDLPLRGPLRAEASVRHDTFRAQARSGFEAPSGVVSTSAVSPQLRVRAPLAGGDFFLTLGRGLHAEPRLAIDPRNGTAFARIDPSALAQTVEIGFRGRLPFGIETQVSMFRAASDLEILLTGQNAITEFSRPTVRQGVQASARYEPAGWLSIDLTAAALRARYADGAREFVDGAAERNVTAAATMRAPGGWTAALLVNYLGKRAGLEESASLRASTFVNARFTRKLSKSTRVTFDVFNVFDQRLRDVDYFAASRMARAAGSADSYLFNPAEPRGFRLRLRTTF